MKRSVKATILYLTVIALVATGCVLSKNGSRELKQLDLGSFKLEAPESFQYKPLRGIDSYVGKIKGSGANFMFDYGLYSPKMVMPAVEYVQMEEWIFEDAFSWISMLEPRPNLLRVDSSGVNQYKAMYNISECLESDSCLYYALPDQYKSYPIQDSVLTYNINFYPDLAKYDFYTIEKDSIYKRIFLAKDAQKQYSGVYILDRTSCSDKINCWKQLSLWTTGTVSMDRDQLFQILKSVELKQND